VQFVQEVEPINIRGNQYQDGGGFGINDEDGMFQNLNDERLKDRRKSSRVLGKFLQDSIADSDAPS
jgi:hypothetical protein